MTIPAKIMLLAALLAACGCSKYKTPKPEGTGPVQKVEALHMYEIKNGSGTWTLSSEYAEIVDNNEKALLRNPIIVLRENGQITSTIKSKEGELDFKTQDVTLTKSVEVDAKKENMQLFTETMKYSFETRSIKSDEEVTIHQHGAVVTAQGVESTADMKEIRLKNQSTKLPEKLEKSESDALLK